MFLQALIFLLSYVLFICVHHMTTQLKVQFSTKTAFHTSYYFEGTEELLLSTSVSEQPPATPTHTTERPVVVHKKEVPKPQVVEESKEDKPILCLATTVIRKRSTARMVAQRNTLLALNSIPKLKVVVFTNNLFWLRYCDRIKVETNSNYESNYAGTPFFKSLVLLLEQQYSCSFYGYVNGDIIFHSNITKALEDVLELIKEKKLKRRVLVTGRRTNIFDYSMRSITTNVTRNDEQIIASSKNGDLFREDALDYFIFTKVTYYWDQIPNLVIGRPLYDNYLLHIISKSKFTDLVDATPSILALHQTDEDGVFAGHKYKQDLNWNRKLIGKEYKMDYVDSELKLIKNRSK